MMYVVSVVVPYNRKKTPPKRKDYMFYEGNAQLAMATGRGLSNGVKGLFAFHTHPHASLITATTDYMHAYYNLIHDMLR